jgi:hypothetical protein
MPKPKRTGPLTPQDQIINTARRIAVEVARIQRLAAQLGDLRPLPADVAHALEVLKRWAARGAKLGKQQG